MPDFLFHGKKRTGKTFIGTTLARENALAGRLVLHNWPIQWDKFKELGDKYEHEPQQYAEIEEIIGIEDADLYIDEQDGVAARDWESMPPLTRKYLEQSGHYGVNLIFLCQHYKFIDIHARRLSPENIFWTFKIGRFSITMRNSMADPETGEAGPPNIFDTKIYIRPSKDLEGWWSISGFWKLLKLSRQTHLGYGTRDKTIMDKALARKKGKKKSPDAGPPTGAPAGLKQTTTFDFPTDNSKPL